ncbi:hypothetical protein HYW55_00375 [Candidatus Gottesmanbacteria bacterium]|nr:hypothetical protein [Candidatus Gottesmanbacteria bacterium]
MQSYFQKLRDYFKEHENYNAVIHWCAGVGVGILITYPIVGGHPLRWGLSFLAIGVIGHFLPLLLRK